jgi:hypothetical protein
VKHRLNRGKKEWQHPLIIKKIAVLQADDKFHRESGMMEAGV